MDIDQSLFYAINTALSNPVFDAVLPWCRERWFWAPLYLFVVVLCLVNWGKRGWVIVLGMLISFGVADFTSSTLIKKQVQRIRPCNDPTITVPVQLRLPHCGGGYSFTSSHACNHFAIAVFLIGIFGRYHRWVRPGLLLWASIIAFSQVYVGVHYPGDVLGGALVGTTVGWLVARFFIRGFAVKNGKQ